MISPSGQPLQVIAGLAQTNAVDLYIANLEIRPTR